MSFDGNWHTHFKLYKHYNIYITKLFLFHSETYIKKWSFKMKKEVYTISDSVNLLREMINSKKMEIKNFRNLIKVARGIHQFLTN